MGSVSIHLQEDFESPLSRLSGCEPANNKKRGIRWCDWSQMIDLEISEQQNGRVISPSRRIYCDFNPREIGNIAAKSLGECTYAKINRCRPSVSIQLPARYHVSILPGWLMAHLDMSFAPRRRIILFPSRKCQTKPLFPKLDINL